ncbi:YARHG domain-containing protein [Abditibacterium utsteinense]|uniref:YARHG domain-containing protein n=1 Tax=Abditibacterium utsteinense TaxID=1960156 RepID=A0A2S8STG2_9BACT|nr:YARHG domain-containing protein [Abditibacterium utsteinense]PQV64091.1 YARHG domain-containing protein [Abditibacterium utsteinense]
MEQTPFDSDAPIGVPSPYPNPLNDFNASPPRRSQKSKWLIFAPLALILLALIGTGTFYLQKQNEIHAREEKLAALRQDIKKIVLQDNALVLEMLDDGALDHITYAEFFKRADKNKEERDILIRNLRATESGPYGEQVGHFVQLMETENEWVRSEEAVSRAGLEASSKWDIYEAAIAQTQEVSGAVSKASRDYAAAPYGEDYAETAALNFARSRLASADESTKSALDDWKTASDDHKEKKASAAVVVADWMRNEPLYYPNFAPKRAILDLLVKKKRDYIGAEVSNGGATKNEGNSRSAPSNILETSSDSSSSDASVSSNSEPSPVAVPKPSPTPSAPTRVRSLEPLEGERFSATRTDIINSDSAAEMSDEDLRYAINEMYARFGMTFKNKEYQAQFEGKSWYSPNERWKPAQIKRAMTSRERANLDVLVAERSARSSRDE